MSFLLSFRQSWTKVWKLDDDSNTKEISFGLFYFVDGVIPLVTAFCNELGSDLLDESQRDKLKQFGNAVLVSQLLLALKIRFFCLAHAVCWGLLRLFWTMC